MVSGREWGYVCVLAFVAIALAETFLPFQSLRSPTSRRWISNSVLFAVSGIGVFLAYQLSGIALAFTMRAASQGALNQVALPYSAELAIGFAALDLTAYLSHRLYHAVAPLWRVHQVHHSETDLDLMTGLRFHPLEALLTQGLILIVIAVLGPPPAAVAFSGAVVLAQDFFQHANLRLPATADRVLRWLIITPAMHRVHHSQAIPEQNTNFGTVFSFWDRLFGTYLAREPALAEAPCGLAELPQGSELDSAGVLFLPFRRPPKQT
jgi:sterol desaturase/sphingolipid hydroxylase (fatty acid hydroxylase superfamily)